MLTDCDMLSRHNTWTNKWRETEKDKSTDNNNEKPQSLLALTSDSLQSETPPVPRTHVNPKIIGPKIVNRTLLAETCDQARTL
jgi:hypothetical protein